MAKSQIKTKSDLHKVTTNTLDDALYAILEARHHDPFSILGCHQEDGQTVIRVFSPHTQTLIIKETGQPLTRLADTDLFEWRGQEKKLPRYYQLERCDSNGYFHAFYDPYIFPPLIPEFDLDLFASGKHLHIYNVLGAHPRDVEGISGVLFSTWAPNAERVSLIGNFNQWDGRCHPMRSRGSSGVWELFIPGLTTGELYKFEIRNRNTGQILEKADPYAQQMELRPCTGSMVFQSDFEWQDEAWLSQRASFDWLHQPMSIYELHLGSWRRGANNEFLSYREIAVQLVDYIKQMGFTHIELLPITEHPLDASWGYQTTGYFTPTSRFGPPDDFRFFVDLCHQNNIGVLLDWVPAHFPRDEFALAQFDGSALYEHDDPRLGEHPDWGTLIFNYGRNEVRNFLISSAIFWLKEYHIDGLRVDAVASMLYLDYSREDHQWAPNMHGGNENIEAMNFLREFNEVTHREHPGTVVLAEESTAWPQVTRPTNLGGLGFSVKWNMGWMHDTLEFMSHEPIHRSYHHNELTFGLLYVFTENFILPFSHDEVVHGKGSLLNSMPGDEWQRIANLRLLYTYMFTYPGKKLLFMGCEFAQGSEWQFDSQLDWYALDYPHHQGVQKLVSDLNKLYRDNSVLHQYDFDYQGFEWLDCNDSSQSVLSYIRKSDDHFVVVILNFTPEPRHNYRIGVPAAGQYREVLNSDSSHYYGSNVGNNGFIHSDDMSWMGRPYSISMTLPPLAGVVLELS